MARAVGIQRGARARFPCAAPRAATATRWWSFRPGRVGRQHLPLRAFLAERGYEPHGWQLRFNLGPREGVFERSVERVRKLARSTGRKVSLVGWSLGGVYAREIAAASEDVRCVITLGTRSRATRARTTRGAFTNSQADMDLTIRSVAAHPRGTAGSDDFRVQPQRWHRGVAVLPAGARLSPRASRSPRATSAWE